MPKRRLVRIRLTAPVGQTPFIGPALRHLALRGTVLPKRAAGAAFRYAKLPPHVVDALAAA